VPADWLPAYEVDHRRLNADVRKALLQASRATLDRRLIRRGLSPAAATTRPGTLLRHQIPIRTGCRKTRRLSGDGHGALCAARSMTARLEFDPVDIHTTWNEMRARPIAAKPRRYCRFVMSRRACLPVVRLDRDNGGEFINHHLVKHLHGGKAGPSPARDRIARTTRRTSSRRTTRRCVWVRV